MSNPRTYMRPASPGPQFPPIALNRTAAAADTDTATRQTIQKMCELIRESASDPEVQRVAQYVKKHFACGSDDPAMLAWGVFWWMKHSIKFRSDEATMFRVGEQNQQDLLISPAVLVRMKDPSEDCDGFTMLAAALLTVLGVSVVIATVAADESDPSRWSHVFLCAIVNGRVLPLDTSHGAAPGWMVPKARINRWQTWTLDGQPANVPIPTNHGLNGYTRTGVGASSSGYSSNMFRHLLDRKPPGPMLDRKPPAVVALRPPLMLVPKRGMGQACATSVCTQENYDSNGNVLGCNAWDDSSCSANSLSTLTNTSPLLPPTVFGSTAGCPAGQSDYGGGCVPTSTTTAFNNAPLNTPITPAQAGLTPAQQAALIAAVGNSTVSLIRTATGGPYTVAGTNLVYNPATGLLTTAAGANQVAASLANPFGSLGASLMSNFPLIIGGLLVVLVLPSLLGGRR